MSALDDIIATIELGRSVPIADLRTDALNPRGGEGSIALRVIHEPSGKPISYVKAI
jgi:hypothetical protein